MSSWVGRIFKAGFRSFFFTLFLAVAFAPLLTLILFPRVGMLTAPFVCPEGEMDYETVFTQVSDGTNEETTYFCTTDGDRLTVSYWNILLPFVVLHIAFFFFLIWPLTYAVLFFRYGRKSGDVFQDSPWPTSTIQTNATSYVVDGKQYGSPAEMPPAVRQQYDQAMSALPDANRDGIPDILQGILPDGSQLNQVGTPSSRLEVLQGLRDQNLISESEYQRKRAEILREL